MNFPIVLAAVVATATLAPIAHGQVEHADHPDIAGAILMVVTSHGEIDEQHETGLWLEEFAVPYAMFHEAGYTIAVASPLGGATPIDPRSVVEGAETNANVLHALDTTAPLAEVDLDTYDAVFFPGGHGTMFDLPENDSVQATVAHFIAKDQPAAFVCHGPAALVGATLPDGSPVVKGRRITGFTDEEERAVELDDAMPFLLEARLRELGADFVGVENFKEHVVADGNLITGQNPASSGVAAQMLLERLAALRRR